MFSLYAAIFVFNYLNNPNFNNKSDKIKFLKLQMAARHWQWRFANVPPGLPRLSKDSTPSGVLQILMGGIGVHWENATPRPLIVFFLKLTVK
jgi:hypothetical protein